MKGIVIRNGITGMTEKIEKEKRDFAQSIHLAEAEKNSLVSSIEKQTTDIENSNIHINAEMQKLQSKSILLLWLLIPIIIWIAVGLIHANSAIGWLAGIFVGAPTIIALAVIPPTELNMNKDKLRPLKAKIDRNNEDLARYAAKKNELTQEMNEKIQRITNDQQVELAKLEQILRGLEESP